MNWKTWSLESHKLADAWKKEKLMAMLWREKKKSKPKDLKRKRSRPLKELSIDLELVAPLEKTF